MYKSKLFFDLYEIRKSKHSRSYESLFIMSKSEKEKDLVRLFMLNLTLGFISGLQFYL